MFRYFDPVVHRETRNYGILLIAQLFLILIPAIFEYIGAALIAAIGFTIVIIISAYIVTQTRRQLITALVLAVLVISLIWTDAGTDLFSSALISDIAGLLFFSYAAYMLAKERLNSDDPINLNTLMASICGFIYLGIIGGFLVRLVELTTAGNAFTIPLGSDSYSFMYFSFVTITTLGYGDIVPKTATAQALSIFLAIIGQMYLTIVVALIVGRLLSSPGK